MIERSEWYQKRKNIREHKRREREEQQRVNTLSKDHSDFLNLIKKHPELLDQYLDDPNLSYEQKRQIRELKDLLQNN